MFKKIPLDRLELEIKTIYLICASISLSSIAFAFIKPFYQLITAVLFLLTVYLYFRKRTGDSHLIKMLSIFIICHLISAGLNAPNHLIGNVIETVMLFTMCFIYLVGESFEKLKYRIILLLQLVAAFLAIVALFFFFKLTSKSFYMGDNAYFFLGLHDGRLFGLINPNGGAVVSYMSIITACIWLRETNRYKKIIIVNIALQVFYFALQQSRGALGAVLVMSVLVAIFCLFNGQTFKKMMIIVLLPTMILGAYYFINIAASNYTEYRHDVIVQKNKKTESKELSEDIPSEQEKQVTEEPEKFVVRSQGVSSGSRLNIWSRGLKMALDKPIFGYGSRNSVDYSDEYFADLQYSGPSVLFHNIFLSVLISVGFIGLLFFCMICGYIVIKFLAFLSKENNPNSEKLLMILVLGILVNQMFESVILYSPGAINPIFWAFVGIGLQYCTREGVSFSSKRVE